MIELVTGDAYVEAMSVEHSDVTCRTAFLELTRSLVPPGGRLLDFGCGPGIDARAYADLGLQVHAYDVDAAMCASFRENCAHALGTGQVQLFDGIYGEFLARAPAVIPRVDIITANFAPLNLVADPAELFEAFAKLLAPGGVALVSILNPVHFGDLRYGWWWGGLPSLVVRGRFSVPGAQAQITRWRPGRLAREAGRHFVLESLHVPAARGVAAPRRIRSWRPSDWRALLASRYLFLQLRRQPGDA